MSVTLDVPKTSGNVLKSVNPFNGELLKTYPEMSPDDVSAEIGKAYEFARSLASPEVSSPSAGIPVAASAYEAASIAAPNPVHSRRMSAGQRVRGSWRRFPSSRLPARRRQAKCEWYLQCRPVAEHPGRSPISPCLIAAPRPR